MNFCSCMICHSKRSPSTMSIYWSEGVSRPNGLFVTFRACFQEVAFPQDILFLSCIKFLECSSLISFSHYSFRFYTSKMYYELYRLFLFVYYIVLKQMLSHHCNRNIFSLPCFVRGLLFVKHATKEMFSLF